MKEDSPRHTIRSARRRDREGQKHVHRSNGGKMSPVLAKKTDSRSRKLENSDDFQEAHPKTHHYPHHKLLTSMDREFFEGIKRQIVRKKKTLV